MASTCELTRVVRLLRSELWSRGVLQNTAASEMETECLKSMRIMQSTWTFTQLVSGIQSAIPLYKVDRLFSFFFCNGQWTWSCNFQPTSTVKGREVKVLHYYLNIILFIQTTGLVCTSKHRQSFNNPVLLID